MAEIQSIPQSVDELFALLAERKVDFVLVGGLALLQHVQGRNTEDVDLILAAADLSKLPEIAIIDANDFFRMGKFQGLRVDVLLSENPFFQTIRQHFAKPHAILGREVLCSTPQGLVLMKLYALPSLYRQGDFSRVSLYESDIANLLFTHPMAVEPLLKELASYLPPSDLAEVTKISQEIVQRITRFRRK